MRQYNSDIVTVYSSTGESIKRELLWKAMVNQHGDHDDSPLHPITTLRVSPDHQGARVSSLCFLDKGNDENEGNEGDSSDDDDDMIFRSQQLLPTTKQAQQTLANHLLASCHTNGEAYLWDLQSTRIIHSFPCTPDDPMSSGLAMRQVDGHKLAYQRRDGSVSMYDVSTTSKLMEWKNPSRGFCAMAVDREKNHMLALPLMDSVCTLRDLRQPSSCVSEFEAGKGRGMLMSLAMHDSIVACGMEDGNVCFHDVRKLDGESPCNVKLSSSFILGLDLAPSVAGSMVAVAGMAGNAEDLQGLPETEQGTVAVVKCTLEPTLSAKLRSRIGTCSLTRGGKPGVDVGRFRPDGRLFAIGGWDMRVRLLDRTTTKPLGILKGHSDSVTALDWANNSLLASGDNMGTIHIWNTDF